MFTPLGERLHSYKMSLPQSPFGLGVCTWAVSCDSPIDDDFVYVK